MANDLEASLILKLFDGITRPMRRIQKEINGATKPVRDLATGFKSLAKASGATRIASAIGNLAGKLRTAGKEAVKLGGILGGLATGAVYLFNRTFITTAATFERFKTILETVEGSADKAQASFNWISDFATKTPFELDEVTDAFVKLKAYGIDPIAGDTLRTIGDTASAMGKSVNAGVEALADAVTGEFERLKEFGIKARVEGEKVGFEFTDKLGRQRLAVADKSNREMIRQTLLAIWNNKYAGAMDKQSRTWNGMMSNLKDQWTRFQNIVMESGVFDFLKGELKGVLDELDRMAKSGELKKKAEEMADALINLLKGARQFLKDLYNASRDIASIVGPVFKTIGPTNVALLALSATIGGPLIKAIIALIPATTELGLALSATPIGLIVVALSSLVIAFFEIRKSIRETGVTWDDFVRPFASLADWLIEKLRGVTEWIGKMAKAAKEKLGPMSRFVPGLDAASKLADRKDPRAADMQTRFQQTQVGGKLDISIRNDRIVLDRVEPVGPMGLDVRLGKQLVTP